MAEEIDEALFPSNIYCICCRSLIDRTRLYSLCDECVSRFHWITGRTCIRCGKALPASFRGEICYDCMGREHVFARGFSALTYGLYERKIMMDLKYAGCGYIARKCGDILFDRMEEEIRSGFFSEGAAAISLIVPVPVSEQRQRTRGYNQSAIMAAQFALRWRNMMEEGDVSGRDAAGGETACAIPQYCEGMLFRTRETRMLRSLNPAERAMELKGAFRVRAEYQNKLPGKNVLLVDVNRADKIHFNGLKIA